MADFEEIKDPFIEAWQAYREQPRSYEQREKWKDVYNWCEDEETAPDFIAFYAVLEYQQTMERLHNIATKSEQKKAAKIVH